MSRYRAFALRASLAAVMAATMGAVTLSTGTASAAPVQPDTAAVEAKKYPPTPPRVTVNRGSVKTGQTVRANGRKFVKRERVSIIVRFKPKGSSKFRTVNERVIRADRNGKFTVTVRAARVGTMTIKGRGHTSKLSSTAYVKITKGKSKGSFTIRLASFEAGSAAGAGTTAVAKSTSTTTQDNGLALAGLGAVALIGSAAVTHQVVRRRRRRANVAA